MLGFHKEDIAIYKYMVQYLWLKYTNTDKHYLVQLKSDKILQHEASLNTDLLINQYNKFISYLPP